MIERVEKGEYEEKRKEKKRKKTKHEKVLISFLVFVPAPADGINAAGKCERVYKWQDPTTVRPVHQSI